MAQRRTRLIAALDTRDPAQAETWAAAVSPHADAIKLGLEFAYAAGFDAVERVAAGRDLFLDLKLHDIPNTVGAAIGSLSRIRPAMLTIHAGGGSVMVAAARKACDDSFPKDQKPILLAVTVLTSLDDHGLAEMGIKDGAKAQVLRLAELALRNGADGLVCSAHELAALRAEFGDKPVLVTPGIRPHGTAAGDQKRVMSPTEARTAGADWIVVGRPITGAVDPATAAAAIAAELSA
ncbi:orotidine 5'-phosphate decarboxylase [Acetobacter aceti NRIC 0242]|uniref:Orotidine 5'-phosphate decarboxylase n=1 Tax=Acetobacter aceti NBRC 14818 TaxID=887700 RepID=A0AB33IKW6_ACEAC|nr:orotidine-5'-phosphate decarboxylase [Acetobacter aceti]TCS28383.1 orotidine-5'-phosphate decarboxylase [Acetobacter aceti NBRC 14818]BCK76339.1 orotidine 5'-phosphate decarboxylase [Acetobacter aceti NBRC 14818]GAN58906.1 orotidine 5'-phosphate decarboxylase [Acetobacter aceti NBRC 14818]GBO80549.1 orotidine 5'-phosphate decarboxylase [Acetobacter aceti NRIC 0242]